MTTFDNHAHPTHRTRTSGIAASLLLSLGLLGCDSESDSPEAALAASDDTLIQAAPVREIEEGGSSSEDADEDANLIANVEVAGGGSVRFIDQSVSPDQPGVGMLVLDMQGFVAAIRELEMTPLEVYIALAPDAEAPALLWDHHMAVAESQGRFSLEPRDAGTQPKMMDILSKPLMTTSTFAMTGCTTSVASGAPTWADIYCANVLPTPDACGSGITSGTQTVVTGAAGHNYLGACTSNTNLTFRVERMMQANFWVLVTQLTLTPGHYVEYESDDNLFLNYRSRLTPAFSNINYQWGAARG